MSWDFFIPLGSHQTIGFNHGDVPYLHDQDSAQMCEM